MLKHSISDNSQNDTFPENESLRGILRVLLFLIGLMLPAVSFSSVATSSDTLISRITISDIVVLVLLVIWFLFGRLKFYLAGMPYFFALLLALLIGTNISNSETGFANSMVSFSALATAFLYWLIGSNATRSPSLARALVLGIAFGVMWEAVIVAHDFFLPNNRWFPDSSDARIRGTFRVAAQLGTYAFSVIGLTLCFGWSLFSGHYRRLVIIAGVVACFFVLVTSRRTVIFSLSAGYLTYLVLGLKHLRQKEYWIPLVGFAVITLVVVSNLDSLQETYFGERIITALDTILNDEDSFTRLQAEAVIENIWVWFPMGIGVGNGILVDPFNYFEIHNGHLALAVEIGVLGLIAFYWLMLQCIRRPWQNTLGKKTNVVRYLVISFVIAAFVSMIHLRLHRDRGFAIFLGLVPYVQLVSSRRGSIPTSEIALEQMTTTKQKQSPLA